MAEYQPIATRFLCKGLNVAAPDDAMPEGKFPILENVRSVIEGTLEPRAGTLVVATTPGETQVHSLVRLSDSTPFNGGVPAVRVAGAGTKLFRGDVIPGAVLGSVESGFSGEPLTMLTAQPVGTPQPWLYVADRSRQRKLNVLGQVYETGIAPPELPPTAKLAAPYVTVIENFEYAEGTVPWLQSGIVASPPVQVDRINTTISTVLYDEGSTGHAGILLASMANLGIGTVVVIGNAEQTLIQDIKVPIVDTTIEDILYDDGVGPGLCTIQPVGNLGTATLRVADVFFTRVIHPEEGDIDFAVPRGSAGTPADIDPDAVGQTISREAFVVDGIVQVGSEYVRILSIASGKHESRSFRCRTLSVHAKDETLKGFPTCRVYLGFTYPAGTTVVSKAIKNVLTPSASDVEKGKTIVGGVRSGAPYFTVLPTDPVTGHTDHLQAVKDAKAELIAEGVSLVGPCGSFKITERTAQKLAGIGCGVLEKIGGNQCNNKSVDNVCFPNGAIYDVLIDAGNVAAPTVEGTNTPMWGFNGFVDPDRYISVGANPVPETPPPPDQPFGIPTSLDLSMIGPRVTQPDDELHVSINVDKLDAVQEVRVYLDNDAVQNDYTRNVFFMAFEANDLMAAVQGFNTTVTTPVVDEGGSTAVPRGQSRGPGAPQTTQLSLGNSQWIELRWRVKDMIRVGTDPTRTLKHVRGIQILVQASTKKGPITVAYDSCWLGGGFPPDVGARGQPYTYAMRYRSQVTGATSRPSPAMRGGMLPRRQRVILSPIPSNDPQVDTIDFYRFSSNNPTGAWVGSCPNGPDPFFDELADPEADGAVAPNYREFQPWPTSETPRSGKVHVVGSAVRRMSGDSFNTKWPPDQPLRIKGIDCRLYREPANADFLELQESIGAFDDVEYEVPHPTVMGTPLPTFFGPFEGFLFAVGDPINPGQLNWTLGNNPDVTSDVNFLYVTSPATPLMNGFAWDNAAFVWSTEDLYRILPDFTRPNQFTANVLPCGRGLWTRWAWCLTPQGPAFLAKDGIYVTSAGAPAVSLTDGDLYPLFPHDGLPGVSIRGIDPPDMTQTTHLRLAYADGFVYFDYVTTTGQPRTLVCDLKAVRWFLDIHPVQTLTHTAEEGAGVHHVVLGRANGTISEYAHKLGDDAQPIPYRIRTPQVDGGDPRKEKLFGDLVLDVDPAGGIGATVTVGLDSFDRTLPPTVVGVGQTGRDQYIIDINNGVGVYAKNAGLEIVGGDAAVVPRFYLWETSVIPKAEETAKRATDWDDCGYFGAKFMQGILVEADTSGVPRTVRVEYDGGQLGAVITVNGVPGELQTAHSFGTPFIAHLVRLLPTDGGDWLFYRARWVWEPSPELAAYWITQPTTHDFPGYGHVERVLIAHMSLVAFDLIVTADGKPETYRIPASANAFVKTEILQRPNKGKVYQYALRSVDGSEQMRIFLKDCEVRAKPWGHPDPYQILRPFGDLSREFGGARI